MKTLTSHRSSALAGLLVLAVTTATAISYAYQKQPQQSPPPDSLPGGGWSLSSGIYTKGEPENMPVVVMSVTTDASKGLTSNKVEVQNTGDKIVEAVKFRWVLYKKDEPDSILLKGESPVIGLVLQPGEKRPVNYPVVSFARIHRPLLQNGLLSGDYLIEITVGEVLFADGSKWEWDGIPLANAA
jgi:hypothetical protein